MGQLTPPATPTDFKAQFTRDFKYGTGLETVRDLDIQSALNLASTVFNPQLFDTTALPGPTSEAMLAYLYAAAHFLVISLQAAGGLSAVSRYQGPNSQGDGIITNKAVGGVSIGYTWPALITDNPALYGLTKTSYGQVYLQILMPLLVGNMAVVLGETQATDFLNNPSDV